MCTHYWLYTVEGEAICRMAVKMSETLAWSPNSFSLCSNKMPWWAGPTTKTPEIPQWKLQFKKKMPQNSLIYRN